ncbi:MAG: membrane protein [Candidatus Izimaplasma sp.]|nr:membrane protein [Candidatus Izimaplasma bacterium]
MNYFLKDLRRLHILFIGFVFLSLGIALSKIADLGMSPWGVFHDGLSSYFNITLGQVIIIVGVIVLLLSVIFLKTKVGIGTVLNVVIVGQLIDLFMVVIDYVPKTLIAQIILLLIAAICISFGRALYISSRLGPGPRDGVFVGLSRVTKIDVKYVKPTIEFIVFIIGYLLGGVVGFGTIFLAIISGYIVQFFFELFNFDSKSESQHGIELYFK